MTHEYKVLHEDLMAPIRRNVSVYLAWLNQSKSMVARSLALWWHVC